MSILNKKDLAKNLLRVLSLICFIALFSQVSIAQNLAIGWDGNGKTGAGSEPNNFGWACTNLTTDAWTQAGSGSVRYMDNQSYLPNGRLMFVRWDGVGGSNATSIYSYPVTLEANKTYTYSIKYTRHSNSTTDFVLGVNSQPDNSGEVLATGTFAPASQSFKEANFKFIVKTSGTYYLTIGSSASGMLGSITDLEVIECEPVLDRSEEVLELNYFKEEKEITIFPNGTDNIITLTGFEGITLSANTLPTYGGTIVVSSHNQRSVTGNLLIQQGEETLEVLVVADFPEGFMPTQELDTLTTDGAWCWFADPRAIYHKGTKEQTYFSWITTAGDIVVASYDHETTEYKQYTIWEKFQEDDHANPSLLIRNDGRIIVFIAAHFGDKIYRFISENPEDITAWGEDYKFSQTVTYPYPFQVGDSICVFYRGGSDWHPRLSVSTDNGETFDDGRLFISGGGQRPYTRYCQGPDGDIHVAVTTGHPRNESANKIHYCRLSGNKVYKADGTLIADVTNEPVDLNKLEVVYNGTTYGKGWIWDITLEPTTGYPIMVYASFPTDLDHRYHYGRWNGSSWENTQITEAGKWFPQTPEGASEPEPNYSGGIILDYDDPTTVYLSKEVKGVFEIFKYTTEDYGQTWKVQALTWNTPAGVLNVRPIVPRHHKKDFFDVIWMRGTYEYYADKRYNTALVFPSCSAAAAVSDMELNPSKIELIEGESKQIRAKFFPSFAEGKDISWSSSNENVVVVEDGRITATGIGSAVITATSENGISATCDVTVKYVNLLSDVFFDFGTASSPVAIGAIKITESTLLYDSYGWLTTVLSRDREGSDSELRDFNLSSTAAIFKVYLENGEYKVTVKQGDYDYAHDNMNLKVNGELKLSNITNAKGSFEVNTFDLTISAKYAEFEFTDAGGNDANWIINSILIEKQIVTDINSSSVAFLLNNPRTLAAIYDFSGRLILQEPLNNRELKELFKSKSLNEGLYIVSLNLEDETKTIKHLHVFSE